MHRIGTIAVVAGLLIAVVAGFFEFTQPWFGWLLAVLGMIVGLLNVNGIESQRFLLAGISLLMVGYAMDNVPVIGERM
ncbi:MAG TPA: hypothetical protein VLA20_05395, partial [Vicinamibacterales bacterium]|nr:hypothetical protein [Vicinamibacterales bacterium]